MTPDINKILAQDNCRRSCKFGAPLGDRNPREDLTSKLYLQRIKFVDGDYGPDGTYWGGASPLWCAFNREDGEFATAMGARIYVRAKSRIEAQREVLSMYPDAVFVGPNALQIYDNGGKTFDRYTAVYMWDRERSGLYDCRGMSEHPYHPQGYGMRSSASPGPHLGKRITYGDLPPDCRRLVFADLGTTPF